jgi:hypothetical protein
MTDCPKGKPEQQVRVEKTSHLIGKYFGESRAKSAVIGVSRPA